MFDTRWVLGAKDAQDALMLRREVFVQEMGLDEKRVFDGYDALGAHLIVCLDGQPVAAARMYPAHDGVCMDNICVRLAYRGQGFGDLCTRVALDKARRMGVRRVYARVPEQYAMYYRAFGFLPDGGMEDGAWMSVQPERIAWHAACGQNI